MTIKSNAASVRFEKATKAYGEVVAVDQVSLLIEPGELTTLLGPSGCGKTTTLRLIAGLEMATNGQIFIGEQDVTRLPATDRDVAMVFQSYALFPHMTVGENVAYGLKVSGVKKPEARTRSQDALDLVGLADLGSRMPSELSGGQQQRVAVARALVLEPQVLLFDEPLSNLDAKLRRRVREEIREIQQNLKLTVVYVTHDQEEALAVSDRIVVMKNAVIAQIGTPRELYETPNDAFVADFIGEANILDCEIESIADDMAQVRLGDIVMQLPALNLGPGPAQLAIRPRRVALHAEAVSATIPGTLLKATYVGTQMEYRIDTAHGEIFAISGDVHALHRAGSQIRVGFRDPGPVLLPAV